MLLAQRQGIKPLESVPEVMAQAFQRGHNHEAACIATMQEMGYGIGDSQREVVLDFPEGRITGHLDGVLIKDPDNPALLDSVLEVKAPAAWRTFLDQMYSDSPGAITQRYKWQISIYMVAMDMEATIVCLDEQYDIRKHRLEIPFYDRDAIHHRLQSLEEWCRQPLPRLCDPREYPCAYVFLHEDDVALDHDSEIDELAAKYESVKAEINRQEEKLERIKDAIRLAAGDRKKIKTADSTITFYDRTSRSISANALKDAGIDPEPFMTTRVTKDIIKVKGKDDSQD